MKGYYFDRKLREQGEKIDHEGFVRISCSDLIVFNDPNKALSTESGFCLHEVMIEEKTNDNNEVIGYQETVLRSVDMMDSILSYMRRCALDVIDLWDAPDIIRKYLETDNEELWDEASTVIGKLAFVEAFETGDKRIINAIWAAWYAIMGRTNFASCFADASKKGIEHHHNEFLHMVEDAFNEKKES